MQCYKCDNILSDIELRFNAGQNFKTPLCFKCWANTCERTPEYMEKHAIDYLKQKPCGGKNDLYKKWINK